MPMSNLAKHRFIRVTESAALAAIPARVYGVMVVGGSAATTLKLYNAANGDGTQTIEFAAAIGTTLFVDLTEVGPVEFSAKLYAVLAGTGGIAYVWYD